MTALSSLVSYLTRFFYSRALSVEMYGLFYAGLGLVNTIWTYNDLGFGYSTTYLLPKYLKAKEYSFVWNVYRYGQIIQVVVSLLASVTISYFAPYIANNYFKVAGSENMIYMFCIYLVANSLLSSLIQFFLGAQREVYYSLVVLLRICLVAVFSVVFWYAGNSGATYFALAWAGGYLLTACLFLYLLKIKFSFLGKQRVTWDEELLKKMTRYALPVLFSTLVGSITTSDIFFLTLYRGVREVGVYNIIFPLASTPSMLLLPLSYLFMPLVSHLMEGEEKKVSRLINEILKIIPFAVLYIALFLLIFPSSTIRFLFGEKWLGIADKLLGPLSMGYILSLVAAFLGTIALGTGKAKEKLYVTIVVAIISIPVNIFLIGRYGISGTVISYIAVSFISLILLLKIIKDQVDFIIPWRFYAQLLIGSVIISSSFHRFWKEPLDLITFIMTGVFYSVIFFLFGFILKIYNVSLFRQLLKPNGNF